MLNILRVIKSKNSSIKSGKIGVYYKGGFAKKMTKSEAYLILGVRATASASEIKASHRKLISINHPDAGKMHNNFSLGGSNYLATKINAAKELIIMDAPDFKL